MAVTAVPLTESTSMTSSPAALGTTTVARLVFPSAEMKPPVGASGSTPKNDAAPAAILAPPDIVIATPAVPIGGFMSIHSSTRRSFGAGPPSRKPIRVSGVPPYVSDVTVLLAL